MYLLWDSMDLLLRLLTLVRRGTKWSFRRPLHGADMKTLEFGLKLQCGQLCYCRSQYLLQSSLCCNRRHVGTLLLLQPSCMLSAIFQPTTSSSLDTSVVHCCALAATASGLPTATSLPTTRYFSLNLSSHPRMASSCSSSRS